MGFLLNLLGGKFGLPLLIGLGVFVLGLFAVIGGQQWWIGKLERDLAVAKATETLALAENKRCEESVKRVNDKIDSLIAAEGASQKRIAEALQRVMKSAGALMASAQELVNRPLPPSPAMDCAVLEEEIRAYLSGRAR